MTSKLLDLIEVSHPSIQILDESAAGGDKKFVHFVAELQRADSRNRNGRVYPRHILEREVNKFQQAIEARNAFGAVNHPEGLPRVEATGILWERVWLEGDKVMGQAKVVRTALGRDIEAILEAGGRPGVSSRGRGTVTQKPFNGEMSEVVNEDYNLKTFDVVIDQSVETALPSKVFLEQEQSAMSFKTLAEMREKAPDLYNDLMKAAIDEVIKDSTGDFKRVLESHKEDVRAEVVTEMTKAGKILDDNGIARVTKNEAVLAAIVSALTEAKLIGNPEISDKEVKDRVEALEAENEHLVSECAAKDEAIAKLTSEVEKGKVKDEAKKLAKDHPLAEQLEETLVESCHTAEELTTRFPTVKARFDKLAENINTRPAAKGRTTFEQPVTPPKKDASKEPKELSEAQKAMQRSAGVRSKALNG